MSSGAATSTDSEGLQDHESVEGASIRWIAWLIIAVGTLIRLRQYFGAQSMSYDEARVATEIASRSLPQMLQPAGFIRVAPPGWFILEKLSIMALGTGELALRLVPLIAGLLVVPLVWIVAKRYMAPGAALACVFLAAVSEHIIFYSSYVKQYSSDVLWCLLILLAVAPLFSESSGRRDWVRAGIVGAIAPWFAHPALFLLPASGLVILAGVRGRVQTRLKPVLALGGSWVASLALNYIFVLRAQAGREELLQYWHTGFPPRTGFPMAQAAWLVEQANRYIDMPGGLRSLGLVLFATIIGLWALGRRSRPLAGIVVLTFGLTMTAAALRLYPFHTRLLLFTVPLALFVLGAAAHELDRAAPRGLRPGLLLLLLVASPSIVRSARMIVRPEGREEIKAVVNHAAARMNPDDGMYLGRSALGAYLWYTDFTSSLLNPTDRTVVGSDTGVGADSIRTELEHLRRYRRVWMVFVDYYPQDMKLVLDQLEPMAVRRESFTAPEAVAYLYEFRSPADSAVGDPPTRP